MSRYPGRFVKTCLVLFTLLAAGRADANPDVWVEAALTYHFTDSQVTGLTYRWRFDNYFSSRNIEIYDVNGNGRFEMEENDKLRLEIFDPLNRFGYYVMAWSGDTPYSRLEAENFKASIEDKRLLFDFHLVLAPPANPRPGPVIVSLYDAETVVDFRFIKKNFLLVDGIMPESCKFRISRGKGAQAGHSQPVTLKCEE